MWSNPRRARTPAWFIIRTASFVLTNTMDRQYTRRISEIRSSPELTNLFISWPSESRLIKAKDFSKEMHPILQSNGVTVIDEGEVVTAFLTKDAKVKPANPEDR